MFAAVDCTEHMDICNKFDVNGYPTFKYMSYGKNSQPYNGGREVGYLNVMFGIINKCYPTIVTL